MSEKIDLIFSDIVMPGLGGWELAQSALGLRPGLKILLTSGYPLETARLQTQRNVKLVVLSKPYRKAELAKMIRETLDETPQ
jgi:CheY-like chemotaxis protein